MIDPDLIPLIKSVGYAGILTAILLESGLVIFFFLPGDSLLFTVGFLAAQGLFDIRALIILSFFPAVLGYMLGYDIGRRTGLRLFEAGDSRYFRREHLVKAKEFYARYGNLALVLARFMPVRSFVCFLAGVSQMNYRSFMIYNILGAAIWTTVMPLMGYYFGKLLPAQELGHLILIPIAAVVFSVAVLPWAYKTFKHKVSKSEDKGP